MYPYRDVTGNSDNVLLSIKPNVDFEYVYNVPEDHPTGTFWYHPHKHGSSAIQVGSGMAGVLVIEGDRPPTKESNGDLDTLLRPFAPKEGDYAEVMLLQQIPYACFDDQNPPQIQKDSQGRFFCNDGQTGVVENFNAQFGGPKVWIDSGRYTLINGGSSGSGAPVGEGLSLAAGGFWRGEFHFAAHQKD